ncbi:peptidyl-tRNA hydrolase [Lasiosphaeria hispida]|uniref:peptidyl-tRNA hydrolase n=1 Tax=Lasiosphaeria hispida TaxID=260671 RepID=A0AAJ0MHS1_9PEZI|nr:peptidyl-tRNA hydrolase [Lasiosphaeria hispida]
MSIRQILIVSLGNPGQYRDTFHSVGHMALESLQRRIPAEQPSFASQRHGKKAALTSAGPKYTLLQSPTLMNVTGPWLAKAYKEFLVNEGLSPAEVGLVLVHDDLEEELGAVKIRQWTRSHRGHNGVKSVLASLRPDAQSPPWARISVGIGRPAERDQSVVSDFVLSKMPKHAKGVIDDKASRSLIDALSELERKWEASAPKTNG